MTRFERGWLFMVIALVMADSTPRSDLVPAVVVLAINLSGLLIGAGFFIGAMREFYKGATE